jgi:Ca-activated chloride channel homolog
MKYFPDSIKNFNTYDGGFCMKRKKHFILLLVLLIVLPNLSTSAYAEETNVGQKDKTLAPYFLIEGDSSEVDSFPLKDTNVTVNINGTIADIYVNQTFANEGTKPISANYVFPASTKASVHGMKMTIGDQVITAKIKERETAKKEFEKAKSEGKSASLLEEQRPNVFTMSVANIMPDDIVNIELHYTELIVPTDGVYQYVFPTVVGPRYSNKAAEGPADTDKFVQTPYLKEGKNSNTKFNISVNLSAGLSINNLTCPSHKINIANDGMSEAKVTLADPEEFGGNRDFILNYKLTGEKIQSGLMLYNGEKENLFLLNIQPPERVDISDIPPREYVFLLDVSGSMSGYPLDTAKVLIKNLVSSLRKTDKFNLVLFSSSSVPMSDTSVDATEENISSAIKMIDQADGSGGTEFITGLQSILSIPKDEKYSRSVVIITDGYIDCEKEAFALINKNIGNTNFFSFGIGDSVNRYLIEGIAKTGLGEPFYLTEPNNAANICDDFRKYVISPVLTDIKVEFKGFDTYDVDPENIPTLFAQRPIILIGKYNGSPTGCIKITGKAGNKDFVQEIAVSDTKPANTNSALSYLWARSRIARLSDYNTDKENTDNKAAITKLGLNYSILTPYTSFVAVTETIRNKTGESEDVKQPLSLPLHVSKLAVGGYSEGSEPGLPIMIAGALLIAFLIILSKRR